MRGCGRKGFRGVWAGKGIDRGRTGEGGGGGAGRGGDATCCLSPPKMTNTQLPPLGVGGAKGWKEGEVWEGKGYGCGLGGGEGKVRERDWWCEGVIIKERVKGKKAMEKKIEMERNEVKKGRLKDRKGRGKED